MGFWQVNQSSDALVAIDYRSGRQWSYADLSQDVSRMREALPRLGRKSLGVLITQNRYECLAAYTGGAQR